MEIGDHAVHHLKFVPRIDKGVAQPAARRQTAPRAGAIFQRAHAGRPHRHHALALAARLVHGRGGLRRDGEPLGMHAVLPDIVVAHRQKRAIPHMQGQIGDPDSVGRQFLQQVVRKVQPGRGRGDGPLVPGINGLIGALVVARIRAPDVGRQRHVADGLQHLLEIVRPAEGQAADLIPDFQHLGFQPLVEKQPAARRRAFGRLDQAVEYLVPRALGIVQNQGLYLAAAGFAAQQAPRHHAGVVEHQQIAGAQHLGDIAEAPVPQAALPARQMEQARLVPLRGRLLGDQSRGQLIIIIRKMVHGLSHTQFQLSLLLSADVYQQQAAGHQGKTEPAQGGFGRFHQLLQPGFHPVRKGEIGQPFNDHHHADHT